jgi:hypothetical protein
MVKDKKRKAHGYVSDDINFRSRTVHPGTCDWQHMGMCSHVHPWLRVAERCHIVLSVGWKGNSRKLGRALTPSAQAVALGDIDWSRMHFLIPLTIKSLTLQPHHSSRLRSKHCDRFAPLRALQPSEHFQQPNKVQRADRAPKPSSWGSPSRRAS